MAFPVQALTHVALLTNDRERLTAFYRDFLGLSVVYETDRSVMLRLGDPADYTSCAVVIFVPDDRPAPPGDEGALSHLGFRVASREAVDAWASKARAARFAVEGPIADDYVGYFCIIRDPDGNEVELSAPEGVNRF